MREEEIQAVRDALEATGELVLFNDQGVSDREIYARIDFDVDVIDGEIMKRRVNTLRCLCSDVLPFTTAARFSQTDGTVWRVLDVIRENKISKLLEVGRTA